MSLGFTQAGFRVLAAIDSDPLNVRTHLRNLPETPAWEADLTVITGAAIRRRCRLNGRDLDVVFGGPPCQGFSEIGRRRKRDERNGLLLRFATLVTQIRPRYFVMENVRGLLFPRHQHLLRRFIRILAAGGYEILQPIQLLDASEFGVPQKRRRAFVIGYRRGLAQPCYPSPLETPPPTVADAIGDLPNVDQFAELLTSNVYSGDLGQPSAYAVLLRHQIASIPSIDATLSGITGFQRTRHTADVSRRFDSTAPGALEPNSRCYRLANAGLAPTLRAGTGPEAGSFTAARPIHPDSPRYITVREAARLHSFPDWYTFEQAKWHALRQIGNSVPPFLARAVANEILRVTIADAAPVALRASR
jgi:DNA (cytosine-5)-methyltransferase 1